MMLIRQRRGLGQWGELAELGSQLISVGGAIGMSAIQSDLAKNIAKRQASLSVQQQTIEKERQISLLKAEAATIEEQIAAEARADVARSQAGAGYWGSLAPYMIGGVVVIGLLGLAWKVV